MKYILIALACIMLSGCVTTTVPIKTTQLSVTSIPENFLDCKKPNLPNPKTLTDKQISSLLFKYETEISKCQVNISAIKEYIQTLKSELGKLQKGK